MTSQFDDLLGDFGGDSSAPSTTATTKGSNSTGLDDFDPFGSAPTVTATSTNGGDSSGLLLDFSPGPDVSTGEAGLTTNQSANPLYDDFTSDPVQSTNPLIDEFAPQEPLKPSDTSSTNPLYEDLNSEPPTTTSEPVNPLYEDDFAPAANQTPEPSANPLYSEDFSSADNNTTAPPPANPLYEENLAVTGEMSGQAEDTDQIHIEAEPPQVMNGNPRDWFGEEGTEHQEYAEDTEEFHVEEMPPQVMNGDPREWFGEECMQQQEHEQESYTEGDYSGQTYEQEDNTVTSPDDQFVQQEEHEVKVATSVGSISTSAFSDATTENKNAHTEEQSIVTSHRASMEQQDSQPLEDDEEEEGVYENEPELRDDVVREADKDVSVGLPAAGTASSMRARFLQEQEKQAASPSPRSKREITPPAHGTGGEYVSEPRGPGVEQYEAKPDAGVFESPEPTRNPEVVSSYESAEEIRPQQGSAKSLAAKFKDLEAQNKSVASTPRARREITPPNGAGTAPSEYVSEPRGPGVESYEVKVDAGVFESQPQVNQDVVHSDDMLEEALPERGTAKNLVSRYLQMTEESKSPTSPKPRKEVVVMTTEVQQTRVEYESEPQKNADVVTADSQISCISSPPKVEEFVPQRGTAKNIASRFKELESTAKSPPLSPGRHKEFTPPREVGPVVRESAPVVEQNPDVVHSGDQVEEKLPEKGTAKSMMARFREMESQSKSSSGPARQKKEFTPPPGDAGVYENTPKQFQTDYNRPAESGIVENTPVQRDDVVRGNEPPKYEEELPERGAAKNLVSKWRQMESESAKSKSPGSRPKEFTPPREEPRIASRKSPRTPLSPVADPSLDNGCVHPSELPGQYQPQHSPSVYESTPDTPRDDVLREGERDYAADLPKKNTAKKMLARFQSFQEKKEDKTASPRQDSESSTEPAEELHHQEPEMENARLMFEDPAQVGRSKSMRAAIHVEKCGACGKTVYAMERLEMNKTVYHKACFRCSVCRSVLTAKTFAINNGVIFCTTHYKQLFTTKGNYDEGFGRQQHKKRWGSNPNLATDHDEEEEQTTRPHNGHHNFNNQQQEIQQPS